jgi:DNA polymerase IV
MGHLVGRARAVEHEQNSSDEEGVQPKKLLAKIEHVFYTSFMRVVCVYIPHFYVQVKRLAEPGLGRRPLIIGGMPEERTSVIDCSEEAEKQGVSPGMSMKDAYQRCPDALFIPFEEDAYQAVREEIATSLTYFTLRIESKGADTVYLDVTRVPRIYAGEDVLASAVIHEISTRFRLTAKAGLGNSRFVAMQAARSAHRNTLVIPPGEEKRFLSPMAVEELPIRGEIKERLHLLGLHTMKKVARLPLDALIAQFGSAGKTIWELVNGVDEAARIPPTYTITHLEREMICESPLDVVEHLKAPLKQMVEELTAELRGIGRLCRTVKITLSLRNGDRRERYFVLQTPTASREEIMGRVWRGLEFFTLENPVTGFALSTLALCACEATQEPLFRSRSRSMQGLNNIKGYLKARYGEIPLMRVAETDRNARLPERRFVFVEV